jgi:GT2 family glycosyltransferase
MNNNKAVKTVIGIVSFNDKKYLSKTLPLISGLPDSKVLILDNAGNDEIKKMIREKFPQFTFIRHKKGNIGFSKGHNYILENSPGSEYYFCLNSDILLEEKAFKSCIYHLDNNSDTCITSAKLHHWDFHENKKTNIIDTVGIIGNRAHHFWDRGQGKTDEGQYDDTLNNIFGISGAAFIIRRSKIKKIHGESEKLFDTNIFMYKDDVDLAYRLRWLGEKIVMLKDVLGYHARTLPRGKKKNYFEARMSYRNHLIMLRNNFSPKYSIKTKWHTFVYELSKFFFLLFTKPGICKELYRVYFNVDIYKSKKEIKPKKMEKFLLK